MLRTCCWMRRRKASSLFLKGQLTPLEALTQIQLGIVPSLAVQRGFLLEHCERQLEHAGITEAKLLAMDGRLCTHLLKKIVYALYLSVPFRVFTFDMEFTGPPVFTADGPTEDITELGAYSPLFNETFSSLVQPVCGRQQGPGVEELTHISDSMLAKEGLAFEDAWNRFLEFVERPQPGELEGSEERILLLSHGGKLADVSLIKWTLEKFGMELPSSFVFGDTINLIRDAHRRRPVTVDKHPPSWALGDLVQWLHIPLTLPAHRAGNDARMTWDALYHTLLRYGDDEMSPREQLVPRFFDAEAKRRLRENTEQQRREKDPFGVGDTFLLADATHSTSAQTVDDPHGRASARSSSPSSPGRGATDTSDAVADLLDLDFDDIFSESQKAPSSSAIEELQLVEEANPSIVPHTALTPISSASPAPDAKAARSKARQPQRRIADDVVAEDEDGVLWPRSVAEGQKTTPRRRQTTTAHAQRSSKTRSPAGEDTDNTAEVFLV